MLYWFTFYIYTHNILTKKNFILQMNSKQPPSAVQIHQSIQCFCLCMSASVLQFWPCNMIKALIIFFQHLDLHVSIKKVMVQRANPATQMAMAVNSWYMLSGSNAFIFGWGTFAPALRASSMAFFTIPQSKNHSIAGSKKSWKIHALDGRGFIIH